MKIKMMTLEFKFEKEDKFKKWLEIKVISTMSF